jgi:hypothetical protein
MDPLWLLLGGLFVFAAADLLGFAALNGASQEWVLVELAGSVVFGLVAWAGASRWPVLIGIGWLAAGA